MSNNRCDPIYGIRQIISERRIKMRIRELASEIVSDFTGKNLTVVFISNGAVVFAADLIRNITIPLQIDSIDSHSYQGTQSTGKVVISSALKLDIKGRHVLLIDDILDTGRTLSVVLEILRNAKPADIKTCVLLDKPARRKIPIEADYRGFEIPDQFVVGYGLDFDEYYRNLPFIGVIS